MHQLTKSGGLEALEELRGSGAIAGFGIGVNEVPACLEVMKHARLDVILLAGRYTLLEQTSLDELFPACVAAGTSIVVGGPYNSGILAVGTQSAARRHRKSRTDRRDLRPPWRAAGGGRAAIPPGAPPGGQHHSGAGFTGTGRANTFSISSSPSRRFLG
jgi:aryl-alcohol dehydrogenase-like predicted oxidoreductase